MHLSSGIPRPTNLEEKNLCSRIISFHSLHSHTHTARWLSSLRHNSKQTPYSETFWSLKQHTAFYSFTFWILPLCHFVFYLIVSNISISIIMYPKYELVNKCYSVIIPTCTLGTKLHRPLLSEAISLHFPWNITFKNFSKDRYFIMIWL